VDLKKKAQNMPTTPQSDKLSRKTKIFYGIGDIGNAVVNSAIQFFITLPLLLKYPVTRKSHAKVRRQLDALDAATAAKDNPPVQTL
jgi:Na+/melibiose symporter-like transporter